MVSACAPGNAGVNAGTGESLIERKTHELPEQPTLCLTALCQKSHTTFPACSCQGWMRAGRLTSTLLGKHMYARIPSGGNLLCSAPRLSVPVCPLHPGHVAQGRPPTQGEFGRDPILRGSRGKSQQDPSLSPLEIHCQKRVVSPTERCLRS